MSEFVINTGAAYMSGASNYDQSMRITLRTAQYLFLTTTLRLLMTQKLTRKGPIKDINI